MESFYGGKNGKSFEISRIFTTKFKTPATKRIALPDDNEPIEKYYDSMQEDLAKGWTSDIGIDEFVIISYGKPGIGRYENYRETDSIDGDGQNYNSSLWQKKYDEVKGAGTGGLYYKLISQMTGNTPWIVIGDANDPTIPRPASVDSLTEVLNANENPICWMDITNIDNPILYFALPQAQVISEAEIEELLPAGDNEHVSVRLDMEDINHPIVKFKLPRGQVFQEDNITLEIEDADVDPFLIVGFKDPNTKEEPTLEFHLPQARSLSHEHHTIDADEDPTVVLDQTTDVNNPKVTTNLPRAWDFDEDVDVTVLDPSGSASASLSSSSVTDEHNFKRLALSLPRGVKFYYGDKLGQRQDIIYTLADPSFAGYGVGDFYINEATGFIYQITAINGTTATFEFVACIQSPLPTIGTVGISPYKNGSAGYEQNDPKVIRSFTNNDLTAWKLEFQIPKMPLPAIKDPITFLGPLEEGSVTVEATDPDTMTFDFKIPTGSRMFAGTEVAPGKFDTVVDGARPGDLYLNGDTGTVYILQKSGIWEIQQGSLKGPVGDALHIVRDYRIQETDTTADSLDNGVAYILDNYKDSDGDPIELKPDEIFAVTWISNDADKKETSYWYYYTDEGKWGRVQLTGGVNNLIKDDGYHPSGPNDDTDISNTTYSIRYINSLIGGKIDTGNMDKVAFSKDQIYGLLSWGSWEDAIAGDDIPEPENHDTLSAEEVIKLMSWGSIAKLSV